MRCNEAVDEPQDGRRLRASRLVGSIRMMASTKRCRMRMATAAAAPMAQTLRAAPSIEYTESVFARFFGILDGILLAPCRSCIYGNVPYNNLIPAFLRNG